MNLHRHLPRSSGAFFRDLNGLRAQATHGLRGEPELSFCGEPLKDVWTRVMETPTCPVCRAGEVEAKAVLGEQMDRLLRLGNFEFVTIDSLTAMSRP